jgi:hypothetical protein
MRNAPPSAFFSSRRPVAPYLVDWHQAFATLDPVQSLPLTLHFDRGPDAPIQESLRIPNSADPYVKQRVSMYLSVLINNVLCMFGAKSVRIESSGAAMDKDIVSSVRQSILLAPDSLTNSSLDFIHQLIEKVYAATFAIEIDSNHAAARPDRERSDHATARRSLGQRPEGSVLAINIGQYLTSIAVVRLDAQHGYQLERFTRLETWPRHEQPGFPRLWLDILTRASEVVGQDLGNIDAIALSIAATVANGGIIPVEAYGLFSFCSQEELDQTNAMVIRTCGERFPGLPVTIVNDAEAQSLFAFTFGKKETDGSPGHVLSLRLGACPCIRCLDQDGFSEPGIHEYGWLATKRNTNKMFTGFFSTTKPYLTHYGVPYIAWELSLLEKYAIHPEQAIPFFHDKLLQGNPSEMYDARTVYFVLGAHMAMLAAEVHRHRPLGRIMMHGSRRNKIDDLTFDAMRQGFYAFSAKHGLSLEHIGLACLEDSSAHAGLVGAALAALRA